MLKCYRIKEKKSQQYKIYNSFYGKRLSDWKIYNKKGYKTVCDVNFTLNIFSVL